ncbi:hypothetical protein QBC44DRAFT_389647 [Cladorrhinum sp. PSN332]|nr:hypothetical protein QBC44DRAFT_389647 [Cladorrhinum sp. PSN332]
MGVKAAFLNPKQSRSFSFDRQSLCQAIWNWPGSDGTLNQQQQQQELESRLKSFETFFGYYKDVAASYVPEQLGSVPPALNSHDNLFTLIRHIKKHVMPTIDCSVGSSDEDMNMEVSLLTTLPSSWSPDRSYNESNLSTRKLVKVASLKLTGTNDLRNHLRLNAKSGVLEIYHHTSVLKQHLLETKNNPSFQGNVPQALALETLDTIYTILFPFADPASQRILRRLIAKEGFDPGCRRSASSASGTAYGELPEGPKYRYWGTRLVDLFDEVDDPAPRGYFEKWLQRKSGARYAMMATLVGVMIAVFLGILGLAVGIFQAWVAYQQWKHPVQGR